MISSFSLPNIRPCVSNYCIISFFFLVSGCFIIHLPMDLMAAVDASEPADPMPRRQRLPTEVIGRSPLHPRPLACDVTAFPPSGTPAPIQLINAGIFVYNFFFSIDNYFNCCCIYSNFYNFFIKMVNKSIEMN